MKRKHDKCLSDTAQMVPPSTPDKYPPSSAYGDLVRITVGERALAKSFQVHKGILTFYSGYFEAALRHGSTFTEAAKGEFDLEDEDGKAFEKFVHWLYSRQIDDKTFSILIELWLLADRRQVPLLMNTCLDAMRAIVVTHWVVPTNHLSYIYRNTTPESQLRTFVVALISNACTAKTFFADGDTYSNEVLSDMLKLVCPLDPSKRWSKETVQQLELCPKYHCHEEGVTCSKK